VTPKRLPKRRGPAKKYAPETTDVTPVKKPRRKVIPKKGAKFTAQAATASTVIAIPEYPTPSASPLDEKDEASRIPAYFQSCSSKMMEEYERMRVEIVLAQNYKPKKRGSRIVHDTIVAAEVSESEVQTQSAYPVRQLEQVVYYSQHQSSQQTPEPLRGVKDVLFSAPSVYAEKSSHANLKFESVPNPKSNPPNFK